MGWLGLIEWQEAAKKTSSSSSSSSSSATTSTSVPKPPKIPFNSNIWHPPSSRLGLPYCALILINDTSSTTGKTPVIHLNVRAEANGWYKMAAPKRWGSSSNIIHFYLDVPLEVRKWFVNGIFHLLLNGADWGYKPLTHLLVTSWDIQVGAKLLLNFQAYGKFWKKSETLRISWKSPSGKGGNKPVSNIGMSVVLL